MRIDAADRLFSVSLTRITSVPECAVSSVGFLWGSAAVSLSCGVSVGLAEAPDWAGLPGMGTEVPPTSATGPFPQVKLKIEARNTTHSKFGLRSRAHQGRFIGHHRGDPSLWVPQSL